MTGRGLLLNELERIARSCCRLGRLVEPGDMEFRPQPGMRTLAELGNHMAQSPLIDLRIISGAKQDEVQEFEDTLWRDEPAAWCELLREGLEQVRRYMETLSFDHFENSSCTAYYGRTQTNAQWLLEMIAHLYHDRAQFFTYLKLLGYTVDARILAE